METTIPNELLDLKARLDQWRANRKYLRQPLPPIYGKRSSPSAGDIPAFYCVAF
jgi:hypothetical protein